MYPLFHLIMTFSQSDRKIAAKLWRSLHSERPFLAMLTTASAEGVPHATWMGTVLSPDPGEILTLTSPDSLKISNLRQNPAVEWLISEINRKELLYLRGKAHVVEEVADLKRCWQRVSGKGQAFFLNYFNTNPGFAIIRTLVESAELVVPEDFRKVTISPGDLFDETHPP